MYPEAARRLRMSTACSFSVPTMTGRSYSLSAMRSLAGGDDMTGGRWVIKSDGVRQGAQDNAGGPIGNPGVPKKDGAGNLTDGAEQGGTRGAWSAGRGEPTEHPFPLL